MTNLGIQTKLKKLEGKCIPLNDACMDNKVSVFAQCNIQYISFGDYYVAVTK